MIKILYLLFLVIGIGPVSDVFGQRPPDNFWVKNVYIGLDGNTRFVRKIADKTISMDWQKESNYGEIECFKAELMKTKLFEGFNFTIDKLEGTEQYSLNVSFKYQSKKPIYKIDKIELNGFNEIDKDKFKSLIAENGLKKEVFSLKTDFPKFEEQITELLEKSYRGKPIEEGEEFPRPWIEMQLNTAGGLDFLIMPAFKGCSSDSK